LSADQSVLADTILAYDTEIIDTIGITNTAGSFVLPAGTYKVDITFLYSTSFLSKATLQVDATDLTPVRSIGDPALSLSSPVHRVR
jgi:hypothetical protein